MSRALLLFALLLSSCASGPSPEEEARLSFVVRARAALDRGDTAVAIQECETMLAAFPGDPMAEHMLIASLSHSAVPADKERRERLIASAASRPAKGGAALFARANARREAGDLEGALSDLDRLIAKDGPSSQALTLRAVVRAQRRDFAGALADYDEAIELSPGVDGLRMQRAVLRIHMGDSARGEEELAAVAERNPEIPWPHVHLAQLRLDQGRLEEALASAEKAARLRPRDPQVLLLKEEALSRLRSRGDKNGTATSRPLSRTHPNPGGTGPSR